MHYFETIVLGLIQGLTEFIPVSSSGHLVIAQDFFSGASDHLFLEFINIGTLLALLVFFRQKIIDITKDVFVKRNYKLAINLIVTAVPAGLVGYFLADFISSNGFFGSLTTVAVTLAIVGILMIIIEKLPKLSHVADGSKLSTWRALAIGTVQIFALIPGVSRSGSTIIAGRLSGLSPSSAAEYSFLASIPIMLGVTLKIFMSDSEYLVANLGMLSLSNLVAFLSGMFAIGFLMKYLARNSLAVFGWYRLALSVILGLIIIIK